MSISAIRIKKITGRYQSWMESIPSLSVTILLSATITYFVFKSAWISDDAFITLRYVSNTLNGYGPVFNPGEYVQGYTHPLWFILVTLISVVFPDPILNSIYLGLALTFATFLLLGFTFHRLTRACLPTFGLLAGAGALCVLSDPWVSFQTSGLENSLSHLIIAAILAVTGLKGDSSPSWLVFLMGLLCLNRPDFIFLIIPSTLHLLIQNQRDPGRLFQMALASIPVITWLLFAWFTYGDIIPNTAPAKIGIYPTWQDSVSQGLAYLKDWIKHDTLAAGSTLLTLSYGFANKKSMLWITISFGVILYGIWIVWIGGDFMRGRFFTPLFFTCIVLGLITACPEIGTRGFRLSWKAMIYLAIFGVLYGIQQIPPDPGGTISEEGVVNERAYYPGYTLAHYAEHGTLQNPYLNLGFADQLRSYAEICGPITIHNRNPGTLGYLAGPDVHIIDMLGLTDSFIAKLPNEYLVDKYPRPGHPIKYIPVDYLFSRQDIAITPGWEKYIYGRDCSILEGIQSPEYSDSF